MQIRTPKRYQGMQRRSVFSCGRFFISLIMVTLILIGVGIYYNRDLIQPTADRIIGSALNSIEARAATQMAPLPTATPDPSVNLVNGGNAWERGNITDAVGFYEQIIDSVPNDVMVYQRMTVGLLTRGEVQEALDYAEHTVTADPFSPDAWATRSLLMSWQNDYQQGIASALQALDFDKDHAQAKAFLAYGYWGAGQVELASSRADEAIALDPDRWEGYWVRGLIRENSLLDITGALDDFGRAFTLASEQNPAMAGITVSGMARILVRPEYRNYDRAVELLEQMRSLDPDNRAVLYTLGEVQFRYRGDYGQALSPLTECTRINPQDYDCQYLLGRTYNSLDNTDAALLAFEAAIEAGSPWARHYWWAANMYIAEGKCSEATPLLQTGFRMAQLGDLPADDEGADDLITEAFPALMSTCRVSFGDGNAPLQTPTEATEEG
ncbi:MAG: tetratricopeptide repeat protein [Anaerolineae bacterium]|nr:tetratricopeptide repeat protein [Anaerolineae bacterium]